MSDQKRLPRSISSDVGSCCKRVKQDGVFRSVQTELNVPTQDKIEQFWDKFISVLESSKGFEGQEHDEIVEFVKKHRIAINPDLLNVDWHQVKENRTVCEVIRIATSNYER